MSGWWALALVFVVAFLAGVFVAAAWFVWLLGDTYQREAAKRGKP